jgi:hypothetical protein
MAQQITPLSPSLPATTAIQDPATRQFAAAVSDILRTAQSPGYALSQLTRATAEMSGGNTPAAVQQWLVSTELYNKLTQAIQRVDTEATQAVAQERQERIAAIVAEGQARAAEIAQEVLDRIAAVQAEETARALAVQAVVGDLEQEIIDRAAAVQAESAARMQALLNEAADRGTAISQEATERQSADDAIAQSVTNLSASVGGSISAIQDTLTALAGADSAEATARQTLAAQLRGTYEGGDLGAVPSGLLYQERVARVSGDETVAQSVTSLQTSVGNSLATLGDEIETVSTAVSSEASARQTLASQMRGTYEGGDLSAITSGLLYQERTARTAADQGLAQQITLLSAGAGEQFDYKKIWYFDSGDEGWTGNGTPTVSGGWLRPANATDPYLVSPTGIAADGAQYTQVRLRIRKTGTPTWAGELWWRTAADSTWDSARKTTISEPTYDGNGIGLVTINLPWSGVIDRVRVDLSTVQDAGNGYDVDWVAVGRPSPGASSAALLEESLARTSAIDAEATSRRALSTKLTGLQDPASATLATLSSGLLYDERQARSSADSTEVTARQNLAVKLTGLADPASATLATLSSGLIYDERTARASQDGLLATSISTLSGRVDDAEADISTEASLRIAGDNTQATARQALSTKLTGLQDPSSATLATLTSGLIYDERQARSSADATEVTARQNLAVKLVGMTDPSGATLATLSSGLIYDERTARVAQDGVLASSISTLSGRVGDVEADIVEEASLRVTGDQANANAISGLSGRMGDAEAAITTETGLRVNADLALTQSISTQAGRIDNANTAITSEATTRTNNDLAIVSAVNTALAQITGVSTSISQSGQNLIANWTTAQAYKWNQIEAEVLTSGGQTIRAALAQESNTRSTLAGQVSSTWMVRAQIDSGTGKPYIAGIALGAEGQNGGATSEFIVQADKFVMTMPGLGGYVPFAIGPTGAEFTGLTNWSNVQGATKPQDGATRNVFRGAWTTSTAYALGDIVLKDGNGWSCLVAHTAASGNQPPSSGGGNTWWTLYAVKGADGANAVVAVLSNESHVVPTDSAGNNGNYSGAATTITIYNGTSNDSANWTVTATTSNVSGVLSGKTYTVSGLSADTGYVDLTATRSGYASVVKRFVLSKSKAGTAGAQGPAVVVTSSRATTFTATDGVLDGSQADIVLTASVSGVTSPTYAWAFSGLQSNPVASTTNTQTITAAQFGTAKSATVTCTVNGTYKDQVTLVRLEKSTAAAGATVGSNLADPFSTATWYPGHHTFETVTDGKVGSLVLRLNTGHSNPEQLRYIPLDRTKKYRVRFWARPQAGADGTLYFALRQYISPGVFGPGNTGLAPYKPASVTPGVHNTNFGTDAWGEYSYIWTTADWQADVTLVRPLFLRNYGGTVGYWEVQDLRFEEVTEVEAAKDSAAAANALLADIAADSKLTPVEKQSVRAEWDAIYAERTGIRTQADGFSITTEKTTYDDAFQALGTYLNAGTAYTIGATPPIWITDANLATTTTIVGSTFRANWSNLYADRQALLNKISAEAAKRADWSSVTGSGRPENGATVGANDSNYTGSRGNNLLRNSMLKDSLAGWGHALGPGCVLGEFRAAFNENGVPKGYGAIKLGFSGAASGAYESQVYCGDLAVPCAPGERMELGARVGVYRGDAQLTASFLLSDGSFTLYVPVTGGVSEATNQTAWTQNLSDLQHLWGFVTVPANAVKCYMEVRVKRTSTIAPTDFYIALPYIGKAGLAQTVYSPWNQGVFITPSEVTTWIANAALGNAQIGGDIWSSNFAAGSAGWRIYRDGNAEFRNVTARGDIEASSLKAGVAMIDALNLKGSALIIPIQISYGAKSINLPYTQGEWLSGEALRYTLSLAHGGLFKFSFTGSFYIDHWTGHANYGYGYQTKSVELWIDYVRVDYLATNLPQGESYPLSAGQITERFYWLGPGNHTISIRMWALMADGGARVACSAGSLSIQSFSTVASDV